MTVGRAGYFRRDAAGGAAASLLRGRVWVVAVRGEHDLTTQLRLHQALDQPAAGDAVIVDLSDALFFDTITLAALIGAGRRVGSMGGSIVFVVPTGTFAARLFRVAGIANIFQVCETALDADALIPKRFG
jgi:anti-anti-sigma factor